MNFLMVHALSVDKPDLRMLVNLASVQAIRPRVANDRPEIGSWVLWNTLDQPTPVREEFGMLVDAIDQSHIVCSYVR